MINEALRLIRVFHDLKQNQAAEKLGVSQSYLSEIEKGTKIPTLETIKKYSDIFDIPTSSILFFSENLDGSSKSKATKFVSGKIVALMQFLEQRSGRADAH